MGRLCIWCRVPPTHVAAFGNFSNTPKTPNMPQKCDDRRFEEKYDMTLSDMAKAELGGRFRDAVLAWVDPVADPTKGLEQVSKRSSVQHIP